MDRKFFYGIAGLLVIVAGGWWMLNKKADDASGTAAVIEKAGLIRVSDIRSGQRIQSPMVIRGEARGQWFFEASFPVKLTDAAGAVVAQTHAQADGEWMTGDYVPFHTELVFTGDGTKDGFLILEKDNPSGLPQFDDELRIPVRF